MPEEAPNHVAHFIKLVGEGAYDGTAFHRMVKYGMVQGGDPISKDPGKRSLYGTGGLNAVKAEKRAPKMTRGSVAAAQQPCTTDANRVVSELYRHILERAPDPGAQNWTQQLASGRTTVRAGRSTAADGRCGR